MLTAFSPDWGSTSGGTHVTLLGFGFTGPHLVVKFGSSPAGQVTVVSDTQLTVATPVGPHAPVTVTVTTDGGTASRAVPFRYLAPLYAADARSTTPGNLYVVNPSNASAVAIGPLGVAVTGLAISPGGILFGATVVKSGGALQDSLVTIDPYTARVTTIGPLLTARNAVVNSPDLAFEGTRLLGWSNTGMATIDQTTGLVSEYPTQPRGGGMGLASLAPGALLVSAGVNLSTVNTTTGALVAGPALSSNKWMNSLTFVGATLYGSELTSETPKVTTLVTINPATGTTTIIGALPQSIDAIAGIPAQAAQVNSTPLPSLAVTTVAARAPVEPKVRVGARSFTFRELLGLASHDVVDGERLRRIVPLAALAALGIGNRVALVSASGATRVVALRAPGLGLTANHRQELKLVDTREGFQQIFASIVEVRDVSH